MSFQSSLTELLAVCCKFDYNALLLHNKFMDLKKHMYEPY